MTLCPSVLILTDCAPPQLPRFPRSCPSSLFPPFTPVPSASLFPIPLSSELSLLDFTFSNSFLSFHLRPSPAEGCRAPSPAAPGLFGGAGRRSLILLSTSRRQQPPGRGLDRDLLPQKAISIQESARSKFKLTSLSSFLYFLAAIIPCSLFLGSTDG